MTLDVPCPGLLRLLLAVYSQRGQNLTFATVKLSVSTFSKRIHIKRPRFLSELVVSGHLSEQARRSGRFLQNSEWPQIF